MSSHWVFIGCIWLDFLQYSSSHFGSKLLAGTGWRRPWLVLGVAEASLSNYGYQLTPTNLGLAGAGQHPVISRAAQRRTHSGPLCGPCPSTATRLPTGIPLCLSPLYINQHNKYQPVWR